MIVRWRLSRDRERDGEQSSDSESSEEEASEELEVRFGASCLNDETGRCVGVGGAEGVPDRVGRDVCFVRARSDTEEVATESGRIVGLGDPLVRLVELRRACASRKAATDMRCDESEEATLAPRGLAGGASDVFEGD